MNLFHPVSRPLSDFVDFLWLADGYAQPHPKERLLPTGCMGLVLGLDERNLGGIVSGVTTGPMILDTSKPLSLIGVSFKPGGGFAFFGLPAGELQDQHVSLATLWGHEAWPLYERLLAAPTHAVRFALLEHALTSRLGAGAARDPAVVHALESFADSQRPSSVAAVVERTGMSARRFIATFRDQVGLTPKLSCRLGRFRRVIAALGAQRTVDWAEVALQCGYFDQAHFNHDFREFAGITPTEYLRDRMAGANHVLMRG